MPLHKKRGPVHEINVVPYVDVMLVLLVIFMVTAPLVTPAVIDLPTVDKASAPRVVPLEIFVKTDQGLVVRQRDSRGGVMNEQSLSRAQLPGFIKSLKAKSPPGGELSVLIGGDKNARYEAVLQVMDELRKEGVQKVGLQVKTTR
jgi:biopolymer transport protein TolR